MDTYIEPEPIVQRNVANARERNRTSSVNIAFSLLRTRIPTEPRDRRLSKIETLRLATSYIRHLINVVTARTEGYNGGQVCKQYRYRFHELDYPASRRICTFCLAENKHEIDIGFPKTAGCEIRPQLT